MTESAESPSPQPARSFFRGWVWQLLILLAIYLACEFLVINTLGKRPDEEKARAGETGRK